MVNFIFLSFLVGLPACFGTYMIISPSRSKDREAGLMLILYSFALTAAFAYLLPNGKLVSTSLYLRMPAAALLGCAVGCAIGFIKRKR